MGPLRGGTTMASTRKEEENLRTQRCRPNPHQPFPSAPCRKKTPVQLWKGAVHRLWATAHNAVFSHKGNDNPAVISLLLTLAGDVESNPGPQTRYTCPICSQPLTNTRLTRGSVQCNSCKEWIHTTCTTLTSIKQHNNTWRCSRCNSTTNTSATSNTTTNPPPNTQPSPPNNNTTQTLLTNTTHTTQTNTSSTSPRTTNINIVQINIDCIYTKQTELQDYLHKHNIHIALLQETKLKQTQSTPTFPTYSCIRTDRPHGQGGGLLTYIHNDIIYKDTTSHTKTLFQNDTTMEIQSLCVKSGHKQEINIYNIYIPPETSMPDYTPQLLPLTQTPNTIIAGDFNAHNTAWYTNNTEDNRGREVADQLNSMFILNDTSQHTHIPYQADRNPTSPDITFCSPNLSQTITWKTEPELSSDHLPININIVNKNKPTKTNNTFRNYKKANWTKYTEETEQHFSTLNNSPIENLDKHISLFNSIIQNADKLHIPKGNRRHYNPNYTTEIANLIKQRDRLKHASPLPHTRDITDRIQALNREINNKLNDKKTENWRAFVTTLNHNSNPTKIYKTLKSITQSQEQVTKTHAAITANLQHIPTHKEQANLLINHYAEISHIKPTRTPTEKLNSKHRRTIPLNHTSTPFTTEQTHNIIKRIKNSNSTGLDNISNQHLKHLGPQGIQALTNISNYSYAHCKIPTIWKHGTIITILKPKKDPTQPSSYRPITLLCTPSKITERLILDKITPHIPLAQSQHGFRALHSTSTLLTNLTQHTIDGICRKPSQRTILTTIDISKAFDAIPRRRLITKINNTNMENNTKRWLANYLTGRQAHVNFNGKQSQTRNFPNGVPQGSVLSPTLFNLYMHDMPTPQPHTNTNIASYADDITITTTHHIADTASTLQQEYLNFLTTWVQENRLKIAPTKSTTTLLTSDKRQHNYTPTITLNNIPVPHSPTTKILGVTYDTGLSFKDHIQDIKRRCGPRLNALRALTGTDFGQHKETNILLYKQYIRSVMSYASPAWSPTTSNTHHNTLQTIQNKALRISTGCTKTTPSDHLHHETKVLTMKEHLDMRGTQFYAAASATTQHPCHHMAMQHNAPRNLKTYTSPHKHYQEIFNNIPPPPNPRTTMNKHIHTHLTSRAIQNLDQNKILQDTPPEIHSSERSLDRTDRVHLARLRSGHHPALLSYRKRFELDGITDDTCPNCRIGIHDITHIMEHCTTHTTLRHRHNINGIRDLWENPTEAVAFLRSTGLLGQNGPG